MPEILNLFDVLQTEEEYAKIVRARVINLTISSFYEDMATIVKMDGEPGAANTLSNKAINVRDCHKHMFFDHYLSFGVKDYKRTFFCHNRYCPLCQKLLANTREKKFQEVLSALEGQYDFYHMVLTFPDVRGQTLKSARAGLKSELYDAIHKMPEGFKQLTRYLSGNAPVAGFPDIGYAGAVRTLEITYTVEEHGKNKFPVPKYHCHYHALVAVKKGMIFPGKNINAFSFDKYTGCVTPFSDFEILLQKTWRLIMTGQKVTAKNIQSLKFGYSCQFKKVLPDESHDVFKYIVKPDDNALLTFEIFYDLENALRGVRGIETYGCFRGYKLESDEIDDTDDPLYDNIIKAFRRYDFPVECCEMPEAVQENIASKKFLYISRKSVRSFLLHMERLDDDYSFSVPVPDKAVEYLQCVMSEILDLQKLLNNEVSENG